MAADRLILTPKKPTEAGFYWHADVQAERLSVVEIVSANFGKTLLACSREGQVNLQSVAGLWAGPIDSPLPREFATLEGQVASYFKGADRPYALAHGGIALLARLLDRRLSAIEQSCSEADAHLTSVPTGVFSRLAAIEEKLARAHLREDVT